MARERRNNALWVSQWVSGGVGNSHHLSLKCNNRKQPSTILLWPFHGFHRLLLYAHWQVSPFICERLMFMMWLLCMCYLYALWVEFIAVLFEELKSFFLYQTKTIQVWNNDDGHPCYKKKKKLFFYSNKSNKNWSQNLSFSIDAETHSIYQP